MKKLSSIIEGLPVGLPSSDNTLGVNGFAMLKPGFLDHADEFLVLLANNGWRVIQKKKCQLSREQAESLYAIHKDKPFFPALCDYMCSGDSFCCACQKDCKDPIKDMCCLKDKVRKQWGEDEMKNAMHSSDSLDAVECEMKTVFNNLNEGLCDSMTLSAKAIIISELQSLYAEEINAFYQYFAVKEFLVGKERPSIQKKYAEFAMDELTDHAAKLLKRINELGGNHQAIAPLYSLDSLAHAKFVAPFNNATDASLASNISAEEAAIKHYKDVITLTEHIDPTTNQMLKGILADEETHKAELEDFLKDIVSCEPIANGNPALALSY